MNNRGEMGYKQEERSRASVPTSVTSTWLGMRFEERELYNKVSNEANLECIKELLEGV